MTVLATPERETAKAVCPLCGNDPVCCPCVVDGLTAKATAEIGSAHPSNHPKKPTFHDITKAAISVAAARSSVAKAGADLLIMYPDGDVWFTYKARRFVVTRWDYKTEAQLREEVKQQLDKWDAEHPDKPAGKPGKA